MRKKREGFAGLAILFVLIVAAIVATDVVAYLRAGGKPQRAMEDAQLAAETFVDDVRASF
jgi:hypothetical protein